MQTLIYALEKINTLIWGPATIGIIVLAGLILSIGTRFFQIRRFGFIFKSTLCKAFKKQGTGVSSAQAMFTALGGTLGIGNISGVAAALRFGGPGAIFWMWVFAFFGMIVKYAETFLAIQFQQGSPGKRFGGPMVYIRAVTGSKTLAWLFAVLGIGASFAIGSMTQTNSLSIILNDSCGLDPKITGMAVCLLTGLIVFGGLKVVVKVTEKLVPFMSVLYLLFGGIIIFVNIKHVPGSFLRIFEGAFGLQSAAGGLAGISIARVIRCGFTRGVFTSEAGMGSSSIAHGAAESPGPCEEGLWGIFEVAADTVICCTVTALALLASGVFDGTDYNAVSLCNAAFESVFGGFGNAVLVVCIVLFVLATVISWSYYGEECSRYALGRRFAGSYKLLFVLSAGLGAVLSLDTVWVLADILNGLMIYPNMIAVLIAAPMVIRQSRAWEKKLKHGDCKQMNFSVFKKQKKRSIILTKQGRGQHQ